MEVSTILGLIVVSSIFVLILVCILISVADAMAQAAGEPSIFPDEETFLEVYKAQYEDEKKNLRIKKEYNYNKNKEER